MSRRLTRREERIDEGNRRLNRDRGKSERTTTAMRRRSEREVRERRWGDERV